jgi:hypothetical protein
MIWFWHIKITILKKLILLIIYGIDYQLIKQYNDTVRLKIWILVVRGLNLGQVSKHTDDFTFILSLPIGILWHNLKTATTTHSKSLGN